MQTMEGYFDGKNILPLGEIESSKRYRVRITFLEELTREEDLRLLTSHSDPFTFWNDEREDIYQDYVKEV